jgi:phenylacetate-CoA ligase
MQTVFLNAYALRVHKERYGNRFLRIYENLLNSQYFTSDEIEQYQNKQLRLLVQNAYETVPYYKDLFHRNHLKPADIRSSSDLHKIPLLTKEIIKANFDRLISGSFRKRDLVHGHTSGTTGTPLDVLWDRNTCIYTNAVDWRQKNWAGIRYRDKIALILGRMVVPARNTEPPFWKMDYLHNQLWLSAFHLSDRYLGHYFDKLEKFCPVALEGYPSTTYLLARYLNEQGRIFPLKAVLTSSETLYPLQREAIEKAFDCRVFDFYGMAERVIFATECEAHADHHLNFEYGLTEIVDEEGNPTDAGNHGLVVSTSLQNFGMPLIRYKTSDVSAFKPHACTCGRQMPLLENITTKAEDIIVSPDGRLISPSILTHPFKPMVNIEKSQIIQEDMNSIRVRIVRKPGYTENDTETLLQGLQPRVGHDMKIYVEYADDIERTSSGKYRWVISRVVKNIYDFNT